MESRVNDLYPFKVWIASLLFAAAIVFVVMLFLATKDFFPNGAIEFLVYMLLFSFLYSLPGFIVSYICFLAFGQKLNTAIAGKTVFSLISILGMLITFYVIGGSDAFTANDFSAFIPWIYAASILLAGFLFKFRIRETSPP